MNRIVIACGLALVAATPAFAADLPPAARARAPAAYAPPVMAAYNWSGIYIGINGGYGFGNTDWDPVGGFPGTGNFNINGGLVGGTLGANFQTGAFVFGIEGDGDWSDIRGSLSGTAAVCGAGACTFETANDWLATLRGRIGFALDRTLIYATGGGAAGNVKATFTGAASAASTANTEFGWTAGAGIEYAITDNVTAKVEYLFVDLSKGSLTCTVAACGATTTVPVTFDASLVRGGLNFKFNY
jgi:outer membrane immunogenic protein